ncbi:hypothetical protein ES703_77290 [subsurface metagenome]
MEAITGSVDATNNWWGSASGPVPDPLPAIGYESYGDKVSTNVDYEPWLLREVLEGQPIPTYDKTLALRDGWTLVSTHKEVAGGMGSRWVGTEDLSTEDPGTVITVVGCKYMPGGYAVAAPDDLRPVDALYVKTDGGGGVGIYYSAAAPGVSSKDLVAGWNLVSSATETAADDVLSPLRFVQVGEQQGVGLTTVVSQGTYNQYSDGFQIATLTETDWTTDLEGEKLIPFDGYWVYMNAARSFGVIPD